MAAAPGAERPSAADARWRGLYVTIYPWTGGVVAIVSARIGHGGTHVDRPLWRQQIDCGGTPSWDDLSGILRTVADAVAQASDRAAEQV